MLDLGTVDLDHLERDLVDKLDARLREVLARLLREEESRPAGRKGSGKVTSRLELLELFLRTGSLPWWADSSQPRAVDESLSFLVRHAPRSLAASIRALIRGRPASPTSERALHRLVQHSGDETLSALLALLAPSRASRESKTLLGELLGVRPVLSPSPGETAAARPGKSRWRDAVWQGALQAACLDAERGREPHAFWRQALARTAAELRVTYSSLVTGLQRILTGSHVRATAAGLRIRRLHRETAVPEPPRTARIAERLPRSEALPEAPARSAFPPLKKGGHKGDFREPTGSPPPTGPDTAAELPLELTYSDSDAAYLDNSGLVILWPFLPQFFERLGLMSAKRFHDPDARHRAVGLLQYLATEEPCPPEYQVILGKVLCGVEVTEVFDFGPPVTDGEAEECTSLLGAVIEHAPILKNMSIAGLRGSFLLRKGVLSSRGGTWLLRVEREAFDVVLDRFPWSVDWIQLAWMDAPLGVEW